jgi:hypothetical protein
MRSQTHDPEATLDGIERLQAAYRALQVLHARALADGEAMGATVAGLIGQVGVLKAEIRRLDPDSPLLQPDGVYEGGIPRDRSQGAFEEAFDSKLKSRGVPGDPSLYRARKAQIAA